MIQEGVVTIQPLEQKTVFHIRLELENHRKMNIKTHTHTPKYACSLLAGNSYL